MTNIFKIRKDERWLAFAAMITFMVLNALLIYKHFSRFTLGGNVGAWTLFNNHLHLSGYDPYAYMTLTRFTTYYELGRHPLFTVLLYPFSVLNNWIMHIFDFNASMFIMAVLVIIVSVYSVLFIYRLVHEVIAVSKSDSIWLTAFLFSFASIMTSSMSPDHFIFSLFMLTMSLYVFGCCIKNKETVKWYDAALLYVFTTGVTLSNGVKTLLGVLFVDGKKTFKLKNVFLILLIPSAFMFGAVYLQYQNLVVPRQMASSLILKKKIAKDSTLLVKDSINRIKNLKITGEKVSEKPFLKWIDVTSSRSNGIIEGLFGESVQLHKDYLLGDIYLGRPAVVKYHCCFNYAIELLVFILFCLGVLSGCRYKLMQMILSWFAIDLIIHVVLGFGINEVYINGAHWMFIIPVAIAYLYTTLSANIVRYIRYIVDLLTIYLWSYNGYLLLSYLL